jgi:Tol biopolymer transport system component
MNLWRVKVDEASGNVRNLPEAMTAPSSYCGQLSFSADGERLAYVQFARNSNIFAIAFDPAHEVTMGALDQITHGSGEFVAPEPSPDHNLFAFGTFGTLEDIFVAKPNGTDFRQLTDDPYRDRLPRWSPDGRRIAFYSNRSGKYEIWTIRPDGGGLQQMTDSKVGDATEFAWSPDGSRVAYRVPGESKVFIGPTDGSTSQQSEQVLPDFGDPNATFVPTSWSNDGRRLAGHREPNTGLRGGVHLFSFASGEFERLTDSGIDPRWLSDNRRLAFWDKQTVKLVDSTSKRVRELLSVSPHEVWTLGLARNDRRIYIGRISTEADIWVATFGVLP